MPVVKLRLNLGANEFPSPLCDYKDGEEHEVSEDWAVILVKRGLADAVVMPSQPGPVAVVAMAEPANEQEQELPQEPARQQNYTKSKKEK